MARIPDLAEVSGQGSAKRALEIAAAGGHSLLLTGPAGCGKTLLSQVRRVCALDRPGRDLLEAARERLHLSVRRRFQVLKVARTIADLAGAQDVRAPHLAEAVQYRMLDAVPLRS